VKCYGPKYLFQSVCLKEYFQIDGLADRLRRVSN
jgi:hypothetical protein